MEQVRPKNPPQNGQIRPNGNDLTFFDNIHFPPAPYAPNASAAPQPNLLEVSPPPSPVPKVGGRDSIGAILSPTIPTGVNNPFRPRNNSGGSGAEMTPRTEEFNSGSGGSTSGNDSTDTTLITPKTSNKSESSDKNDKEKTQIEVEKRESRDKDMNQFKDSLSQHHDENNHAVRVFEEFKPDWRLLQDSFKMQRDAIYKDFYNAIDKLEKLEKHFETAQDEFYRRLQVAYEKVSDDLLVKHKQVDEERRKFAREKDQMKDVVKFQTERVKLSVGGTVVETSLVTLRRDPNSRLASMFSGHHEIKRDADGCYFIDRDGTHFRLILNFLRDGRIPSGIDSKIVDEVLQEAEYYQIAGLSKLKWANLPRVSQEALNNMYPRRRDQPTLVTFNFNRQDLSRLNFAGYIIDPKSKFSGCDLENADFENTTFGFDFKYCVDFSNANLMGAKFPPSGTRLRQQGVRFDLTNARTDRTQSLT